MWLKSAAGSRLFASVVAAGLSLAVMGALTAAVGVAPADAYSEMWRAAFGSWLTIATTLTAALPLILVALGFVVAYHAGVFNIGLEGQLSIGALAAVVVGSKLAPPAPLHLPLTILAGAAGGALWAAIPVLLKLLRDVNELVSSLMLNFVAILLVGWLVGGPLKDDQAVNPQSAPVRESAELPQVFDLPGGIVVVVAVAAALAWLLGRSRLGFEMRTVGAGGEVARRVGFDVRRVMVVSFLLSGACAGLAGAVDLLGNQLVVSEGFSAGWGFTGIAVALVGGLSPWGSILAGLFFGVLGRAGDALQFSLGVPVSFALVVQAVAVLLVLVASYLRERGLGPVRRMRLARDRASPTPEAKAT